MENIYDEVKKIIENYYDKIISKDECDEKHVIKKNNSVWIKDRKYLFLEKENDTSEEKEKDKYKFFEQMEFNNDKSNYCVAIGFNPAQASKSLDITNKKLINLLKNSYKGYYLLNLYPIITSNKTSFYETPITEAFSEEVFIEIIKVLSAIDKIIFWGRTTKVNVTILNEILLEGNTYITINKNDEKHVHPAYIPYNDLGLKEYADTYRHDIEYSIITYPEQIKG